MGWAEWIIRWARRRFWSYLAAHKSYIHRFTTDMINENVALLREEYIKKTDLPDSAKAAIRTYSDYLATELDARVDHYIDGYIDREMRKP